MYSIYISGEKIVRRSVKFTPDSKKVIKELENLRDICNAKSNIAIGKGKVAWAGYANTADDAIAILKEQQEQIDRLIEENASNAEMAEGLKELLKEQEAGHWILLENCSNSGVYCSECHTKVFDNYPFKKKFSYFCPHCGTRMEGETERQLDTNLRLT